MARTVAAQAAVGMRRPRGVSVGRNLFWVAPALIFVLVFVLYPIVYNLELSLTNLNLLHSTGVRFVGLATYQKVLSDPVVHEAFRHSLTWVVLGTVGAAVIGSLLGLFLNLDFRGRGLLLSLVLLPWVMPDIAVAALWKWMYHPQMGVINYVLQDLRLLHSGPAAWLADGRTVLPALSAVIVWRVAPFFALLILGGLQSIPSNLYEAAAIDGAGGWNAFRFITVPLMGYPLAVGTLLTIIWIMNNLTIVLATTDGGPLHASEILATLIYKLAFVNYDFGQAAALSILNFAFLLAASLIYLSIFRHHWRGA